MFDLLKIKQTSSLLIEEHLLGEELKKKSSGSVKSAIEGVVFINIYLLQRSRSTFIGEVINFYKKKYKKLYNFNI